MKNNRRLGTGQASRLGANNHCVWRLRCDSSRLASHMSHETTRLDSRLSCQKDSCLLKILFQSKQDSHCFDVYEKKQRDLENRSTGKLRLGQRNNINISIYNLNIAEKFIPF